MKFAESHRVHLIQMPSLIILREWARDSDGKPSQAENAEPFEEHTTAISQIHVLQLRMMGIHSINISYYGSNLLP